MSDLIKANTSSSDLSNILDDISILFPVVARKIMSATMIKTKTGFSEMEMWVLHALDTGEQKPSEISKTFSISKPNVTTLINGLVEGGYALRSHDDRDRRVIRISITEKGKRIISKRRRISQKYLLNVFAKLSNDEIADITQKLANFYKVLLKMDDIL